MKNLIKIGLLATMLSIFAAGCSGCGDRSKPGDKIDTTKTSVDSPKKTIDTTKAKIDTTKNDTSKT